MFRFGRNLTMERPSPAKPQAAPAPDVADANTFRAYLCAARRVVQGEFIGSLWESGLSGIDVLVEVTATTADDPEALWLDVETAGQSVIGYVHRTIGPWATPRVPVRVVVLAEEMVG